MADQSTEFTYTIRPRLTVATTESIVADRAEWRTDGTGEMTERAKKWLAQGIADSQISYAKWVARRIAHRAETIRRQGRWQGRTGFGKRYPGFIAGEFEGHLTTTEDVLDYIRQSHRILTQIGVYRVAEALRPFCWERAKALLERKVAHPEVRL